MKSERRKLYPNNWEQLAWQCKEKAGWRCEYCHIRQGAKRISRRTGETYTVFLHAAHADHDIDNPKPRLLCLCPTCHGTYDFRFRKSQQEIAFEQQKHRMLLSIR